MALFGEIAKAYVEVESRPDRQFRSRIEREAESAGRSAGRRGGGTFGKFFSKMGVAAIAGVGTAAGAALGALGFMGLRTASNLEQAQISFETLLGSGKEARSFLGELKDFSARTPFELPGLQDAARQMLGVGRGVEEVLPALESYGDAAGALGLEQEAMNRVLLASNQAYAKGRLQGEEMMQMMEAGIPVAKLLADAMGVTQGEIQEMASAGELAADEVLPLLEEQMSKEYGGAMERQSKTLTGLWSTFMDTLNIGMAETLRPLLPLMKEGLAGAIETATDVLAGASDVISTAIGWYDRLREGTQQAANTTGSFGDRVAAILGAGGDVASSVDAFASFFGGLFGPEGRVASWLADNREFFDATWSQIRGIVGAATEFLRTVIITFIQDAQAFWDRWGDTIVKIAGNAWRAIQEVTRGVLNAVRGIIETFTAVVRGDWSAAWEGIKAVVDGIWDAIFGIIRGATASIRDLIAGWLAGLKQRWDVFRFVASLTWQRIVSGITSTVSRWGRNFVDWWRELPGKILNAIGNIGSRIKDAFMDVLGDGLSIPLKLLFTGGLGDGPGMGFPTDAFPGSGARGVSLAGLNAQLVGAANLVGTLGGVITSAFRPGSITATGNRSYHGRGRAIDFVPGPGTSWGALFGAVRAAFPYARELIYTPAGAQQLWRGRPHIYSGVTARNHYDHIHLALRDGILSTFNRATRFVAGEAGPEDVLAVPHRMGGLAGLLGGNGGGLRDGERVTLVVEGQPLTAVVRRERRDADRDRYVDLRAGG